MKDYEDPEKLARARFRGGETHSYKDMAKEFDCGHGTISLKMRKYEDEISEYSPEDFADLPPEPEEENDELRFPIEFDLPEDWPPSEEEIEEQFGDGVDLDIVMDEAQWGCPSCFNQITNLGAEVNP